MPIQHVSGSQHSHANHRCEEWSEAWITEPTHYVESMFSLLNWMDSESNSVSEKRESNWFIYIYIPYIRVHACIWFFSFFMHTHTHTHFRISSIRWSTVTISWSTEMCCGSSSGRIRPSLPRCWSLERLIPTSGVGWPLRCVWVLKHGFICCTLLERTRILTLQGNSQYQIDHDPIINPFSVHLNVSKCFN